MKIFLLIVAANFITATIARLIWHGRVIEREDGEENGISKKRAFILSDVLSQPEQAFEHLYFPDARRVFLDYSVFGFNPKAVAKQLEQVMAKGDIVCGISIGAKPIAYLKICACKRILIDPCTHPKSLREEYFWKVRVLAPFAEFFSYLIGWISFLPLLRAHGEVKYSIALLVDQLFWIGYVSPPEATSMDMVSVIISIDDEYLDNGVILDIFSRANSARVNMGHACIINRYAAEEYEEAIESLLA